MLCSVYPEGVGVAVEGLHGGLPGGGVRGVVLDPAGPWCTIAAPANLLHSRGTDRIVEVASPGARVSGIRADDRRRWWEKDVAEGVVSREAAERDYGLQSSAAEKAAE